MSPLLLKLGFKSVGNYNNYYPLEDEKYILGNNEDENPVALGWKVDWVVVTGFLHVDEEIAAAGSACVLESEVLERNEPDES